MKTNLDAFFKTNKDHEQKGVWFDLNDDVGFLIKRMGGKNTQAVKAASAKHYKKYARAIQNGTLPAEKEREVLVKTFVESSVMDWRGVEVEGELKEFSHENCVALFLELPDLADTLIEYASNYENFKEELGNS
jgi:hypothetical protein